MIVKSHFGIGSLRGRQNKLKKQSVVPYTQEIYLNGKKLRNKMKSINLKHLETIIVYQYPRINVYLKVKNCQKLCFFG